MDSLDRDLVTRSRARTAHEDRDRLLTYPLHREPPEDIGYFARALDRLKFKGGAAAPAPHPPGSAWTALGTGAWFPLFVPDSS